MHGANVRETYRHLGRAIGKAILLAPRLGGLKSTNRTENRFLAFELHIPSPPCSSPQQSSLMSRVHQWVLICAAGCDPSDTFRSADFSSCVTQAIAEPGDLRRRPAGATLRGGATSALVVVALRRSLSVDVIKERAESRSCQTAVTASFSIV